MLGSRGFLPEDIAEVIELYLAGAITTEHLTTTRRPLIEANEALADLASGRVLRTVLEPATKGTRWPCQRRSRSPVRRRHPS